MSAQYEPVKAEDIEVGDVIFHACSDHTVTSVEYVPEYSHPGVNYVRPAYLVQFADWNKPKVWRPSASIVRRKREAA